MSTFNPYSKNLIVLSIKLRTMDKTIDYLFPLNPTSLSINQSNRVSATFTYGAKVFQNLGAGLKTISIEGHTGYRLDTLKYGLQTSSKSELADRVSYNSDASLGSLLWLDLYAFIQMIKGENKYLSEYESTIKSSFSIDNIDKIESVKLTIPDQGITYDVLLQNDSFMRNREQPNLYKYKLDFIITEESFGTPLAIVAIDDKIPPPDSIIKSIKEMANALKNIKSTLISALGIQSAIDAYNDALSAVNDAIEYGNFFISAANSSINDLRRLDSINDALNKITKTLSVTRLAINNIKSFSDLRTGFYEPYIRLKNVSAQMGLLKKAMTGEQKNLQFNINLTRLASISAPVTLSSNNATVAQFQKDIRKLNQISFPFPVESVSEKVISGVVKINILFKNRPAALGISNIKIFATNDFGKENNLVESIGDTSLIMSTNFSKTGYFYNFIIEYDYKSFESIIQSKYKSIKRIMIQNNDTIESIVKRYVPNESNSSPTYLSEIAYLNNIEYPYIVTSNDSNFNAYFGSFGFKIFATNAEFIQYIYNIDISSYPGLNLPLYDSNEANSNNFLLQQKEVIDQIKTANKFFVLLMKETYSNRCYALFGMTNSSTCGLFNANSYVLCSLEKGRSYDINNNSLFEILSPYNLTRDLIDYYHIGGLFDSITDPDINLFDKLVTIINQIYIDNIGIFSSGTYLFTETDKTFLSGDDNNENYVILTNFTATDSESISNYSINAFSSYKVLTDGQEILLPSLDDVFLPFAEAFNREDTYKVDLDSRFQYLDDIHASILPRPDLGSNKGILNFKLINGIDNVKQAIRNRLECPQGGLILHTNYGMPVMLGKKNELENLILLRYNLFSQLMSDIRIRSANNIRISANNDAIIAQSSVVLVNNDDILIKTTV